jgi:hypothetical protein
MCVSIEIFRCGDERSTRRLPEACGPLLPAADFSTLPRPMNSHPVGAFGTLPDAVQLLARARSGFARVYTERD